MLGLPAAVGELSNAAKIGPGLHCNVGKCGSSSRSFENHANSDRDVKHGQTADPMVEPNAIYQASAIEQKPESQEL